MTDDGLWRKDGPKEEKPKPKYNFDQEASKPVVTQYLAPDGNMYENSTAYYRALESK